MNLILIAVISLELLRLYWLRYCMLLPKFAVYEDAELPRYPKCCLRLTAVDVVIRVAADFADACVKAGSLEGKFCPVGGQPVMSQVSSIPAGRRNCN